MTLIKELIDIPERVQTGDFVLKLTEGVLRPEDTLRDYVVTPQLVKCFDDALAFIRSAMQTNTSKATYLHGSFGSGKSHFMAVLHLILQGNSAARGIPELAPVIAKHNAWIGGRKFLLVPYHMLGSTSMESSILGGYVDFVRRVHPEAPTPAVYPAEELFRDAQFLRSQIGDEAFFAALSQAEAEKSGWGNLVDSWDAERFEKAVKAGPGTDERSQLINALLKQLYSSYNIQVEGNKEAFLSLDKGLSVLSRHTKSLGYDGLILFLDELVLWLASRATDLNFVHQEGQKLAKLVEAQTPDRPVPIISFVARQRDLSELVGQSVPGAEKLNFGDALKHWEGRFHRINLEDRNLPAIAEKRVLKCKSEAARQKLDAAFEQTKRIREPVMNTLLTGEGDRQIFRQIYPFSPALIQTLIAVSSVLQRERTALKVMMQLLVEQRETLAVGDIVPVGDLFDVIADGDEAFSQEMAIHFNNAKRLYRLKLLPLLEKQHGVRLESLRELAPDDQRRIAFRIDDRLVKTLLLAALVPEVESLRAINAERLAALNHGTIKSPIPGREGHLVLQRCRQWAASVGEIRVGGDEANPTISVQLSGVDTESILQKAIGEDTQGNRVRRVRQMLFEQLEIQGEDELEQRHDFQWHNTRRSSIVLFKNIREASFESLTNADERWKIVIDYPFDQGHGPRDDLSRLQEFGEAHPEGAKTLCWVPAFFSAEAQKDLGLLVVLEHILAGERFGNYADHLSPQDRPTAKSLLENQRSMLRQRVQNHLEAAYGILDTPPAQDSLDKVHNLDLNERFQSLRDDLDLQPPVAANLKVALRQLLGQALSCEFPAAPHFEAEIKISHLEKVYGVVGEAAQAQDNRAAVDRPLRLLVRQIANPLRLGEMLPDATHFVLSNDWKNHFIRQAAQTDTEMTVGQLRRWIDQPKAMGLPKEVQNLVILTFAKQMNLTFSPPGDTIALNVSLSNLSDFYELKEQKLPDEASWNRAIERAANLLAVSTSSLRNANNVQLLGEAVQKKARQVMDDCRKYAQALRRHLEQFGVPTDCDRMRTAAAVLALIERLNGTNVDGVVTALTTAHIATSETAMQVCTQSAADLHAAMESASWELFEAVVTLTDERETMALAIRDKVLQALRADEYVVPLAPVLRENQAKAVGLLTAPPPPTAEPQPNETGLKTKPRPGKRIVDQGTRANLELDAAGALLARLQKEAKAGRNVRLSISWVIEEGGAQP
ncbi:hypothetical protein [Gloeobacter morelensis]|uniref:Phage resistance protein n=1 Tax=Gloeobacter morelensis MG652769 TaxID=2781736 RepID=A0ABY3PJ80_9CYAN|nr:hypothetical protein [Gloeobacter morelensis]UFP93612.1 phage resistance protein [Gloeobacter morelensis MG652769]